MSSPISLKTNNPFNIRYSESNSWVGMVGEYKGFCKFSHESYAVRAMFKLILNYIRRGVDTPRKIITRFAPPSENNTERYIKFVVPKGVDEDFIFRLGDLAVSDTFSAYCLFIMVRNMAVFETQTVLPPDYLVMVYKYFYNDFHLTPRK